MTDVPTIAAVEQSAIVAVEQHADAVTLNWADGSSSLFHYLWLRDCCYCADCGDSYSSKRYVMPHDLPIDVTPAAIKITASGELAISWQHDGHESRYDPGWLKRYRYDDAARAARFHQPILWDSAIEAALPRVDYAAVNSDEGERLDLYRKLRDFGFAVVRGGEQGIESVANLIGNLAGTAYTPIFDLSPSSSVKTMGNTQRAVPPHTDEAFRYSPPGINVLACIRPAVEGGESILVDGFKVASCLRKENPEAFELLCQNEQSFNRIHPGSLDQRSRQRMIELDDRGEIIGIRFHTRAAGPLDLPTDLIKPFYAAHQALSELVITRDKQIRFQLQAGDSVLFDNHRVMHARTEFSDPERFLQICNVDRETFHQRLRLLAAKLGYPDEADMVLAAGVS